jgi:N-acetylneuraminate synthase
MAADITIGDKVIGPGRPCLVVAEIAQAHDGSLGMAHAYIDAAARAGADAVKFQTHIATAESTPSEPWRVKFSPQDETRFDYWRRMEFSETQWKGLKTHCDDNGLIFLSSPFSFEAVELLLRVGVSAWKVPSGETTNAPMLEQMRETGLPIILSTGMSTRAEIDTAVTYLKDRRAELILLQCTTAYPCPPEKIGLNMVTEFRKRYGCAVGLSDHSGTIYPGLAAAVMGIEMLEVHLTFSRDMFGPDVPASIVPDELAQLSRGIRFIEKMSHHPVDKDELAGDMHDLRRTFSKSIVAKRDLSAGSSLGPDDLTLKKPGGGLPATQLPEVIGRKLKRDVSADEQLTEQDLA